MSNFIPKIKRRTRHYLKKTLRKKVSKKFLYIEETEANGKTVRTYKTNKGKLIEWNKETGVLKIARGPCDLETLLIQIGEIPAEGKDIALQIPRGPKGSLTSTFYNVRKIEPIPRLGEYKYLVELKYSSKNN